MLTRSCAYLKCRADFVPRQARHRFCSDVCQSRNWGVMDEGGRAAVKRYRARLFRALDLAEQAVRTARLVSRRRVVGETPRPDGSREIPLTRGLVAIVDAEDFAALSAHRWFASPGGSGFYAARNEPGPRRAKKGFIYMHRVICETDAPHIDHKNGDTLDNRRANLRPATCSQNSGNARKHRRGTPTSRFKGVYWQRNRSRWNATIRANGVRRYLGTYIDEERAAEAYDAAARELFGEFARLNFPQLPGRNGIHTNGGK